VTQETRTKAILVGVGVVCCVLCGVLATMDIGILVLIAAVGLAGMIMVWRLGPSLNMVDTSIVLIIAGYIVLNRGWSYLGIRLGGLPLFVGEIAILLGVLSILGKLSDRPKPVRRTIGLLLVPYGLLGCIHMVGDVADSGLEAIRNFSVVYSIALIPCGYYMALNLQRARRVMQIIGAAFLIQMAYTLLYPWRTTTSQWSYQFSEGVPFIGNHASCYLFVIGGILFSFLVAPRLFGWRRLRTGAFVLVGVVVMMMIQSRAGFVAGFGCILVLGFLGRRHFGRALLSITVLLGLLFGIMSAVGFQLKGDRASVSVESLNAIIRSSFSDSLEGEIASSKGRGEIDRAAVRGMAGSRDLRLMWWRRIINENLASTQRTWVGRGFSGTLVTDDLGTGFMVRHPHNVYITIFARLGIVGSLCFIGYLLMLFGQWVWAAKRSGSEREEHRDVMLFFALLLLATICTGMFSPVFESPHFAVPLFFLFGFATGLYEMAKRGMWEDGQLLADTRSMNS
jgi:hypothetical protein